MADRDEPPDQVPPRLPEVPAISIFMFTPPTVYERAAREERRRSLGPGTALAPDIGSLDDLDRHLSPVGLVLPYDVIRYHTYTDLSRALAAVSRTGCCSTVSQQPIPRPEESGAFLVRFLNDQQNCVTRYMHRRFQRWQREPATAKGASAPRRKEGDA